MKSFNSLLFLAILSIISACTKEIDPPMDYEPQIFIFGTLGSGTQHVSIEVQETVPVKQTGANPVGNASIALFTKGADGSTSLVTDNFGQSNGTYTSVAPVSTLIGNYYWIEVDVPGKAKFKSAEELLKPGVPIDGITRDTNFTKVLFKDPGDEKNLYYLGMDFFHDGNFIFDTEQLSSDTLFNGNDDAFIEADAIISGPGYSVEATLYNLNYGTYQFYFNLFVQEDANSEEEADPGHLFATPPVHLTGNIVNLTTNRAALGNFGIIGQSTYETSF